MDQPEPAAPQPRRDRHPLLSNWMIAGGLSLIAGPILLMVHRNWGTLLLDFGLVTVLLCMLSWIAPENRRRRARLRH